MLGCAPIMPFAGHAAESASTECKIPCASDIAPPVAARIQACKIELAAHHCATFAKDYTIRNCEAEAFCTSSAFQDYITGCLVGSAHFAADAVLSPIYLLQAGLAHNEKHAKYYDPGVDRACRDAAANVAGGESRECEATFFRAACPKTLVRNCKTRLLEDFPDLKASYGEEFDRTPYARVADDVHARLGELSALRPSLAKWVKDHPNEPFQALLADVRAELVRQSSKFACVSQYEIGGLHCKTVLAAVALVLAPKIPGLLREAPAKFRELKTNLFTHPAADMPRRISDYIGDSAIWNESLRQGLPCSGACRRVIKAFETLPNYEGRVYRGIMGFQTDRWRHGYLKVGNIVTDDGFVATSRTQRGQFSRSGPAAIHLVIESRTGKYIGDGSTIYDAADEVVILPGKKFRVDNVVQEADGAHTVYMTELP